LYPLLVIEALDKLRSDIAIMSLPSPCREPKVAAMEMCAGKVTSG
jgi:hypothetical protein